MAKKRVIALTPGSESGVGPELLIKALCAKPFKEVNFLWCGDKHSLETALFHAHQRAKYQDFFATLENGVVLEYSQDLPADCHHLMRQAKFLEKSIEYAKTRAIDAIVTGPIEKAALAHLPHGPWPGQTEYFAHHLKKPGINPVMTFLGGPFALSLLTTHMPLTQVSAHITEALILSHVDLMATELSHLLNKPKSDVHISVLGLNPHAGEQGLLGHEEQTTIIPAIKKAQMHGLKVDGPWPADGFFAYSSSTKPDAVVAMYHDQGLIPFKILAQGQAVNVTLGLSVPRMSPAHGTAQELVGTGRACHMSTLRALECAVN